MPNDDYRELLNERFKGITTLMNAQFKSMYDKLHIIDEQTKKTNNRVNKLEELTNLIISTSSQYYGLIQLYDVNIELYDDSKAIKDNNPKELKSVQWYFSKVNNVFTKEQRKNIENNISRIELLSKAYTKGPSSVSFGILGAGAISMFVNISFRDDIISKETFAPCGTAMYLPDPGRSGAPSLFGRK